MEYRIEDLAYGGKYHDAFWNIEKNPNATIANCLANCTTGTIGFGNIENHPMPVSKVVNASNWDKYLINDYVAIPFSADKVKVGDILQWVNKCHVCKVADIKDGIIYVNSSFYTGEHGVSVWQGSFDTREVFHSLKEVSDFMVQNYPSRFYHHWKLEKECSAVGGTPEHIIVLPMDIAPTDRNPNVNQIQTTDTDLRVRTEPNLSGAIIGHVSLGYYNVLDQKEATDEDKQAVEGLKCWYKLGNEKWVANVTTIYLPADNNDLLKKFEELTKQMALLLAEKDEQLNKANDQLDRIRKICEE